MCMTDCDILNEIFAIAKWLYFFYTSVTSEQLMDQPMYEYPPPKYSAERILQILLHPNLGKENICQKKPTNVTCSATFVVDTCKLQNPKDIKKDEFGIWKYSGSHPQPFLITVEEGGSLWIERCSSGATGSNVETLEG